MKIIAISDIHGRANFGKDITNMLSNSDLIVISGDITDFGDDQDVLTILQEMKFFNSNILAVPGNCDKKSVIQALKSEDFNLHEETKEIAGITFFGLGGSCRTPFATPQEYSDSEAERILNNFTKKSASRYHILVSHAPPRNTKVDRTMIGLHAGSKPVRKFIEEIQPDLCICGHIHEARGVDKIGKTIIINPGPFPRHYVVINISKKITWELK